MSLYKGDIVLVPFPFTDLTSTKLRPAVVLWSSSRSSDVTLCFVSSQNLTDLTPEEFLITNKDAEFVATGFKTDSKVRVSRIVTLERSLIRRRIGKLESNYLKLLNCRIAVAFILDIQINQLYPIPGAAKQVQFLFFTKSLRNCSGCVLLS